MIFRILVLLLGFLACSAFAQPAAYRRIAGTELRSVLPPDGQAASASVAAFEMRVRPVTNGEFLRFVMRQPHWQRGRAPAVFTDERYLGHWAAADVIGKAGRNSPVTHVSWFAAQAFCEHEAARLPTWHEWELAAAADELRRDARDDPVWRERILSWYSRPSVDPLPAVGNSPPNIYGIRDLHGLVWEWVDDHAGMMVSSDNREQGDPDLRKFCGAGALSVADRENYAILMRIALLSSLQAKNTTANLGFRCARDLVSRIP
ncbi:MAG: formylglycine-generating enzyme family protein [Burkholderiales bacterium]